tara:strand:+ start:2381 stop:3688 length:1308 start_codon:yes stop_codon:yes gene_type:complete
MIQNPQFFIGVVEDIHDPSQLNRVRVRIFGKHIEDITLLPTKSLPWYNVVMPVTSASTSGIGQTLGLVQGSWVFGTFIDGPNEQEALILGSLPGESTKPSQDGEGFKDPEGIYPKETGTDTPNSATDSISDVYKNRLAQRVTDIPIARQPHLSSLSDDTKPEDKGVSLPDPKTYYNPQYPYNNVAQTECGHAIEHDDTPTYERISTTHCSGTSSDIISDGSKIDTIVGDGYTVHSKDNTVYIVGNCNLTVDGDVNVKCEGNYVVDVGKDMTFNVEGNVKTKIGGDSITELVGKREFNIGTTDLLKVKDGQVISVGDDQQTTIGVNQTLQVGASRTQNILANDILIVGADRNTTITNNDFDICLGSKTLSSSKNLKINCPEKIHINTPNAKVSGDVLAGSGGVSLITHMHSQPNTGANATSQGDTNASIGGTGVGS